MRISVTGSNGFLGQKLIKLILNKNHHAIGWSHTASEHGHDNRLWDLDQVEDMDLSDSEILIHCASYLPYNFADISEAEKCMRINGIGTLKLLHHAEKAGVKKFIYLSSGQIYNWENLTFEVTEIDRIWPTERATSYLVSKMVGDLYVDSYKGKMETAILRPSHIYGPGMKARGLLQCIYNIIKNNNYIDLNNIGYYNVDLVYVEDVVKMAYLAATKKTNGIYNVGGDQVINTHELTQSLAKAMNKFPTFLPIKIELDKGHPPLNIDKAKRIGYSVTDLNIGLKKYVDSIND